MGGGGVGDGWGRFSADGDIYFYFIIFFFNVKIWIRRGGSDIVDNTYLVVLSILLHKTKDKIEIHAAKYFLKCIIKC